jgi:uncharacterized protein
MVGAISEPGDLLDINIWLALAAASNRHHKPAQSYWQTKASGRIWFCRHTALGVKRLLGQRAVMGEQTQTTAECWATWQTLMRMPSVALMTEPANLEICLTELVRQSSWPGKMWSDAYLAAFAIAANLRLVSFDRDFARFPGLNWLHLPTEVPA